MPLKKSSSAEALHSNIRELIKSGHNPKQAIAIGLSNQRKFKHMADGGIIEHEVPHYPEGQDDGLSLSVDHEDLLAKALEKEEYGDNSNSVHYNSDYAVKGEKIEEESESEEQPEFSTPDPVGLKPEPKFANDGPSEPLSEEAKAAILLRKQKRRFS